MRSLTATTFEAYLCYVETFCMLMQFLMKTILVGTISNPVTKFKY